jgi:crotonobetainyl-CoA:carnitine CoA-transferase CaiB-like acyl-CoA transferase
LFINFGYFMQILQGVKVIELGTVLAVPSVGQFLAELGAEVLKIENPKVGGDVTRTWKLPTEDKNATVSAYFSSVNWGKKTLALDITQAEQLAELYAQVRQSDIVIANYKAGDAEKLKVSYQDLIQYQPNLLYGHITGYGVDSEKVGYDAVIQAEAGFIYINGEPNGNPVKMPVALIDLLAAHQLKEALLVAWIHRLQTGKGSYTTVSLFDAAVASLANQATNWLVGQQIPQRLGSEHPNIVPYGKIFATKDHSAVLIAVGNDKQFIELCQLLNLPELAQDYRFATNPQRVQHRQDLLPILEKAFLQYNKTDLLLALEKAKIPAGAVNTMPEVFNLPLAQALLLQGENGMQGVRNFIANFYTDGQWIDKQLLTPPPMLK